MRIPDQPMPLARMKEFTDAGYWRDLTAVDALERQARENPQKLAIIDPRARLTYLEYWQRTCRLAAYFEKLGLTSDDVIAVQLPNWSEYAIAIGAAMSLGVPFCQFHTDYRAREVEFILSFTEASVIVLPNTFRSFDHLAMLAELRPRLPNLRHVLVVGDNVPPEYFDLRGLLEAKNHEDKDCATPADRRPHANALMRTAFTSGTTGNPKAVLHIHNTTNSVAFFLNDGQRLTRDSVFLVFLPVGLNWGLLNVLQALFAGCTLVLQDVFKAEETLAIIERHSVTHFCCAPAHLVALLNSPGLDERNIGSLQVMMTGGASCPIEVIQETRRRIPGHLLEMYGMLEVGTPSQTTLDDDPEAVCGLVGKPLKQMGVRVVDDNGTECSPGAPGEIVTRGPSIMIGYYNNPEANAKGFSGDGWFHTGDLGVFDENGYLKIVGRKKEMIIRGGANIYPREIEEVLYQHPKVRDAAIVGMPDARLGEKVCACIVPRSGETFTFEEMSAFLKPQIATYKLPEFLEILSDLPRTPTGKVQKTPLRDIITDLWRERKTTSTA